MQSRIAATESFRNAVAAGAFLVAEQLLGRYRDEVQAAWNAATSARERRAIELEVNGLLAWARTTTLSARSHVQRKLILLERESAYTRTNQKNERLALNA